MNPGVISRVIPALLVLAACSGEFRAPEETELQSWAGPEGSWLSYCPIGAPDSVPLMVYIAQDSWELRYGEPWRTATEQGLYPVVADAVGYRVDDSLLLPASLEVGTSADGTTIQEQGEVEVWYGTFPDVLTVEVGEGTFRGEAAFADGVGPILLSYGGRTWELLGYQRD